MAGLVATFCATPAAFAQTAPTAISPPPPTTVIGTVPTVLVNAITGTTPVSVQQTVPDATQGGVVQAGNTVISFPPGSFGNLSGPVTITVTANPNLGTVNQGGAGAASPNGTQLDITIHDQNGNSVTVFPQSVTVVTKPGPADLSQANGDFGSLTLYYVIDSLSPGAENPNHFPVGTRVLVDPKVITKDPVNGVLAANLNFLGSVLGVVSNPVSYVQTVNPNATLQSSFDAGNSQSFGKTGQFSYLQVVEPQIGNRLLVLNPATGNYAYVDATDVGPSGPPPAKSSTAVVRGLVVDSSAPAPSTTPALASSDVVTGLLP